LKSDEAFNAEEPFPLIAIPENNETVKHKRLQVKGSSRIASRRDHLELVRRLRESE
jgi:hypothetical protein